MGNSAENKNSSSSENNIALENILAEFGGISDAENHPPIKDAAPEQVPDHISDNQRNQEPVKVSAAPPAEEKKSDNISAAADHTVKASEKSLTEVSATAPAQKGKTKTASDDKASNLPLKEVSATAPAQKGKTKPASDENVPVPDNPGKKETKKKTGKKKSAKNKPAKQDKTAVYIGIILGIAAILAVMLLVVFPAGSGPAVSQVSPSAVITAVPEESPTTEPEADTVDSAFLADLNARLTLLLSSDEANLREAVKANIEADLELLTPYTEAEFTDETLGTIALNYIDALNKEAASFEEVYEEADLLWYEGYVQQMQMLTRLSGSYGFMSDNTAFTDKFVTPLSAVSTFYNKYSILSKDIRSQIDGITYLDYVNDYRYKTTLKNRTNYTFDITFYFDNYNEQLPEDAEEAAEIEPASSAEDALTNITPLKSYVVTDRVTSGVAKMKTFVCHWTITSID